MMKFKICFICVTVILSTIHQSEAIIKAFEEPNFQGDYKILLPFKGCMALASVWEDRISSVNTDGGCIILCEHRRCLGRCEKIFPGTRSHNDLAQFGMDNQVSSYRNCESSFENNIPN